MINIELIESTRISHGYSQEVLSEKMGYTHSVYGKKVKIPSRFTIEDIVKLCHIFSLELSDLIIL